MTIATFMILDQLQIAQNIVVITSEGLIGAIALGSALAFGLGGREVAGRLLEGASRQVRHTSTSSSVTSTRASAGRRTTRALQSAS